MKIDKEQRNVSLYSLNASEKRNVKIMVRGMTKMRLRKSVEKNLAYYGLLNFWSIPHTLQIQNGGPASLM